jgi:hypothetical protein
MQRYILNYARWGVAPSLFTSNPRFRRIYKAEGDDDDDEEDDAEKDDDILDLHGEK